MTLSTLTNRLLNEGTIERIRVNRYILHSTFRTDALHYRADDQAVYTMSEIHQAFATGDSINGYWFRTDPWEDFRAYSPVGGTGARPQSAPAPEPEPLRTIRRDSYHDNGGGICRHGVAEALNAIARDPDGVRRSFGLEWEIYNLTAQQEDKLARLLDTLPAHFTERDGSLGSRGVEIIFLPLGKDDYIRVWNTLKDFCQNNFVEMNGTGAHTTYGVSDSEITEVSDLQIRLNRVALAIKATSTQGAIKRVFGRDFTGYATLPSSTTYTSHSNAWSASRGLTAYELRLCNWQGNVEKIVALMKATEFVFHRTFNAQDFINIFTLMGSDCSSF